MAYGKTKVDNSAYIKLKKDLSEDSLGSLYIFRGEEVYLRDFYLGQMKKKLLPPGMEDFNLHTLEGKSFDLKTLQEMVDCLPMMGSRTMVIVTDYDIYKGDRDGMAALLGDLPDYVCLVFVYDLIEYKSDAKTKIASMLKGKNCVVDFARQEQGDLSDWVRRRFRAMDKDIAGEDAKYLIFLCGDLMNGLISEIGKIGSYAKDHRVTRADIDAVATPQLDAVVFQMTDAISAGDYDKAASVLGDLLHMQEPPIKIFYSLGKQLRGLYAARLALDAHKNSGTVMEICGLKSSWQADRLLQSARRFSLAECRRAVVRCGQADLAMKSGGGDPADLLVGVLLDLAGGREHAQN
ncbi:MAG: DNA polymerase III subunit delta [Pseudoflavonifractor sp.]